jgi:hypothetical protein
VRPDDLYEEDIWPAGSRQLNTPLLDEAQRGPLDGVRDIELAVPLARIAHDEYEAFSTGGGEALSDHESWVVLRTLTRVADRLGLTFAPPFRDFKSFKGYWLREGASHNYQARRNILNDIFNPLHDQLADLEAKALGATLATPISPHARTGWPTVDTEISELRRHFQNARTAQDYRGVGNDCVHVMEALSAIVYVPATHLRPGEDEPPVQNTKQRLERYIEDALPGSDNARLRKLAKATIEVAQEVKHSATPSRKEAGIAADAVIQLANVLRRLAEDV